jgi:hypothetical protein
MASEESGCIPVPASPGLTLIPVARYPGMRPLLWKGDVLYAARGYQLLRARIDETGIAWKTAGRYHPVWWRRLGARSRLASRLFREGFHALALLSSGELIAAVPGAILSLPCGGSEFTLTHQVLRGTRPLHFAVTPDDRIYWGEYFDNPSREQVHIYGSSDGGLSWTIVYEFPQGAIRHVHNIVYDRWENCLWVLTGDDGAECRILRAACDFSTVRVVLCGNQQARAVALLPQEEGLYFSSDTPLELNHIYRMDRTGRLSRLADLSSSSIYGCCVGQTMFFSTMVEPSEVNTTSQVSLYGLQVGSAQTDPACLRLLSWNKDGWPGGALQYGNACLPDGENTSGLLALSTVAVETHDQEMSVWRVEP